MLDLIKILTSPLSLLFYIIVKLRNLLFDKRIFQIKSVSKTVISVGNLTVGGSGKTPAVIMIAQLIKQLGYKPAVLSRGYLRKSSGYKLVSDGEKIILPIQECGDEIFLTSHECRCATAVCEKRVEGAEKLIKEMNPDVIVLDDAYQHRWIKRNLNILIFDQRFLIKSPNIDQNLLPLGLMRETFSASKRADLIIINRKFSDKQVIASQISRYFKNKPLFNAFYKATSIVDLKTEKEYSLSDFRGQKSLVICGIAKPFSFLNILEKNQIDITNKILFSDHKHYNLKDIKLIRKTFYDTNCFSVLTTQKDAVKLSHFSKELDDIDIFYLKIELELEEQEEFNKIILQTLKNQ